MMTAATFLDALIAAVEAAGSYNQNDQSPPTVVLWPDKERQWTALMPWLWERLPLLALGDYAASTRTGPAYWIRCVLGGTIEAGLPAGKTPVIYLPGVGRADLRAVEDCPRLLQPLAELQYSGVLWSQPNGRDWTVAAFLQNAPSGLGIEVAADAATREALSRTLSKIARVPLAELRKEAPIRAAYLDSLLNPDEARSLLNWLDDPVGFRKAASDAEWAAFRGVGRSKYGFDPEGEGELTAARYLGRREGAWSVVWNRFAEAPAVYPNLPSLLRRARPRDYRPLIDGREAWPQENEAAEAELRSALSQQTGKLPADARTAIARLDAEHGQRRAWIWARLGDAPLAQALEPLTHLASETAGSLGGMSTTELATSYAAGGWRADAAMLDALALVEATEDVAAVKAAIMALYRPWLENAALWLQNPVQRHGYPATTPAVPLGASAGTCVLFSDGLRYDLASRLAAELDDGCEASLSWRFAALPTVTATAKPDVSPVAGLLTTGPGFDPTVSASGTRVTADVLRRLLIDNGWQVLRGDDLGDPSGTAWTELGDVDSFVHEHGWKVAHHRAAELRALKARIQALLSHGWQKVVVVTDHGWLLLPGGLPKAELPEPLTEVRKGRCARLKATAMTSYLTVPWRWDPSVQIVIAPGIHCFEAGTEGEHGGISPQECVTPVLTVQATSATQAAVAEIQAITWRRLRCQVQLSDGSTDLSVDIRLKPNDPTSSLAGGPVSPKAGGIASLVVPDEDHEGQAAVVVVTGRDGNILAQQHTTVGG